jgi:LPS-assembly protein
VFTKVDIPSDKYFFEDFYNFSFLKYTPFTQSYIVGRTQTDNFLLETNINYFYDLTSKNNKQTLQRLPEIRFYLKEKQLSNYPVYYDFLSESTYFYREEGTSGFRFDNTLRLSNYTYFGKFLNILQLSPKFTVYLNTKDANTLDTRFLIPVKNTTQTTFIKNYSSFNHIIIPQISFDYISKLNQSNLPFYDRNDRINEKEDVDFTLYNILNFKNDYFLRWELSQGYSLLDYYYIGNTKYNTRTKSLKNSIFMNIKGYSLDSVLYYDWEKGNIARNVSTVSIPVNKYINYSLSYIEDKGDVRQKRQLSNSLSINYLNYAFSGYILTNLQQNYTQRKSFTFNWNRGCWSLSVGYLDDYNITTQKHYRMIYVFINILDIQYKFPFIRN